MVGAGTNGVQRASTMDRKERKWPVHRVLEKDRAQKRALRRALKRPQLTHLRQRLRVVKPFEPPLVVLWERDQAIKQLLNHLKHKARLQLRRAAKQVLLLEA